MNYAATGGFTLTSKCAGCATGVGIGGGLPDVNGDEVSGLEALRITFPNPIALHSLWLGYIYPAGIWDNSNESVCITFDGSTAFTLTAVLGTTATITGATASVTSVEPATMGYGGVWQISFNGFERCLPWTLRRCCKGSDPLPPAPSPAARIRPPRVRTSCWSD